MNAAAHRWTTRSQRLRRVALALVVALSAFAAFTRFRRPLARPIRFKTAQPAGPIASRRQFRRFFYFFFFFFFFKKKKGGGGGRVLLGR